MPAIPRAVPAYDAAPPPTSGQVSPPPARPAASTGRPAASPKRKKSRTAPVVVTVLVLVLGIGGLAAWVLLSDLLRGGSPASASGGGAQTTDPPTTASPTPSRSGACNQPPSVRVAQVSPSPVGADVTVTLTSACGTDDDVVGGPLWVQVSDEYGTLDTVRSDLAADQVVPASGSGLSTKIYLRGDALPSNLPSQSSAYPYTAVALVGDSPSMPTADELYRAALAREAGLDAPLVRSDLMDQWSPQIDSKYEGLTIGSTTWDAEKIWGAFRSYQDLYPSAVLLKSDDWKNFDRGHTYWVVFAGVAQSSDPAGPLAWCGAQGFGTDDCLAKYLTDTVTDHTVERQATASATPTAQP